MINVALCWILKNPSKSFGGVIIVRGGNIFAEGGITPCFFTQKLAALSNSSIAKHNRYTDARQLRHLFVLYLHGTLRGAGLHG